MELSFHKNKWKRNPCGSQAPVAHACNPSYSGSRDQEDRGSGQIVRETLSQKNLHKNRVAGMTQGEALRSRPSTEKKRKKEIHVGSNISNLCLKLSNDHLNKITWFTFFLTKGGEVPNVTTNFPVPSNLEVE
jgi:hypothetical protein